MENQNRKTLAPVTSLMGRMETLACHDPAPGKAQFPNFPLEIIVEILSRLPLDSLSRFTCVSKQWLSLISDISPTKTGKQMVLVMTAFSSHSINLEQEEAEVRTVRKPWETNNPPRIYDRLDIFGSCNCLLLIVIDQDLFLWNPLTRYFKRVLSYHYFQDYYCSIVSGLCYDSLADEYKAVVSLSHHNMDSRGHFVVVGGLRSKTWRDVPLPYTVRTTRQGPIVNGNLHWFVAKETLIHTVGSHQIVYFDPQKGRFMKVPMPKPRRENGDVMFGLGVLDGCLCMARQENWLGDGRYNMEVLTMKEYGKRESWSIMFKISNLNFYITSVMAPLVFAKNGETLFHNSDVSSDWHIRSYNPKDNSRRDIPILIPTGSFYVDAEVYEESLVKPIGYDWEEDELRGTSTYVEYSRYGGSRKFTVGRDGYWESFVMEEDVYEQSDREELESGSEPELEEEGYD